MTTSKKVTLYQVVRAHSGFAVTKPIPYKLALYLKSTFKNLDTGFKYRLRKVTVRVDKP